MSRGTLQKNTKLKCKIYWCHTTLDNNILLNWVKLWILLNEKMALITVLNLIMLSWMKILHLYLRYLNICGDGVRRWWVKPHIKDQMRDIFGAYEALFLYFFQNDHDEFLKMVRMTPNDFEDLHDIVGLRLKKFSIRRPLPSRLRLALTLK